VPPIESTIEIAASPDRRPAYVTDPTRFGEWQDDVVSVWMDRSSSASWCPPRGGPVGVATSDWC
jgi:hypothetical protein